MTYEHFKERLNYIVRTDEEFLFQLLCNIIKNPNRYTGIFRLSNPKTKLIQNVTQSIEIKFGDFMEDIITEYIAEMGFINLNKNIGQDENGDNLSADQIFHDNKGNIILIEQKIRDDHDSTKKRGQYSNFRKKYYLLKRLYPKHTIYASMWFIDSGLLKNKRYYLNEAMNEPDKSIRIGIFYGEELFINFFRNIDIWNELVYYLTLNKQERSNEELSIPNFDTDSQVLPILYSLSQREPNLYKKLRFSSSQQYIQLRNELFPTGLNFKRLDSYNSTF